MQSFRLQSARISVLALLWAATTHAGPPKPASDLARAIDAEIAKQLEAKGIPISPRADDAELQRRLYLDLAGVIPPANEAAAYLASTSSDRSTQLIEKLLASPEHARRMTDLWKDLLIPQTAAAARRDQLPMIRWLKQSIADNKPWDKLAYEVITAKGMQDDNPATTFYIVQESVDMVTDRISRVFLGLQLQCAQCHDHPFEDWKRNEYWALAGFFSKVGTLYAKKDGREMYGADENVKKTLMLPDSARKVPLQFLRGAKPDVKATEPHLPVVARWLTAPDNPYFARAMVNRVWHQFFGRGLVNPVDSMHVSNKATHPEVLELLTKDFIASGFDARRLIRAICLTETYQRSSRPLDGNKDDRQLYSHAPVRGMTGYALHDSWERVLGVGDAPSASAKSDKATYGSRNGFANFFSGEEGGSPLDYHMGIPQALRLMNGKDSTRMQRAVGFLNKDFKTPELVDQLFLLTVSRLPRPEEKAKMVSHIEQIPERYQGAVDVLWSLLNSTEFYTNH